MSDPPDIDGDPPLLIGTPCDDLFAREYWYRGAMVQRAVVIYTRFAGRWHRLFFDGGIVFWRTQEEPPEGVPPGEDGSPIRWSTSPVRSASGVSYWTGWRPGRWTGGRKYGLCSPTESRSHSATSPMSPRTPFIPTRYNVGSVRRVAWEGDSSMVPARDILGYLRTQPFRPFQIRMTGGRTFDIRHPEMVRVGRGSLILFTFVSDDPDIYDHWTTVSLMLIESVTHLETPAA